MPHFEQRLLSAVAPHLERRDWPAMLNVLTRDWPRPLLIQLLASSNPAVSRTAAASLGIVGDAGDTGRLALLLAHPDPAVAAEAEDALWRLWMRAPSPYAQSLLADAVGHVRLGRCAQAIHALEALTLSEPTFAEGFHQLGIALHSLERLDDAEAAYRRALELNPWHFAACAALGHLCVQRGDPLGALPHYRRAVTIHPRLAEISELLPRLEAALAKRNVA